jgi:hypothetical protein
MLGLGFRISNSGIASFARTAGAAAAGAAPRRAGVLNPAHTEGRKFFPDVFRAAFRTFHALISEDELFKVFAARIAFIFKNRHVTSPEPFPGPAIS